MPYTLPPLPYDAAALEPHIDTLTMQIHHGKHHAAYVNNVNAALEPYPELAKLPIERVVADLSAVPEAARTAVRNNGGGHANHTLFWESMTPGGDREPTGALRKALDGAFGSFAAFQEQFAKAGMGRFGSGWAWLSRDAKGTLRIESTSNQDTPLMDGRIPLLGCDVWEHAYYLKYQNRRADYLTAWWHVVNWSVVARRLAV